jgi:hypothetical protein
MANLLRQFNIIFFQKFFLSDGHMASVCVCVCVCIYIYVEKMTRGRIEVYAKLRRATKQRFKSSGNRKDAFNNLGRGLKRLGLILQRTRGYYIPTTALGSNWTTIIS